MATDADVDSKKSIAIQRNPNKLRTQRKSRYGSEANTDSSNDFVTQQLQSYSRATPNASQVTYVREFFKEPAEFSSDFRDDEEDEECDDDDEDDDEDDDNENSQEDEDEEYDNEDDDDDDEDNEYDDYFDDNKTSRQYTAQHKNRLAAKTEKVFGSHVASKRSKRKSKVRQFSGQRTCSNDSNTDGEGRSRIISKGQMRGKL